MTTSDLSYLFTLLEEAKEDTFEGRMLKAHLEDDGLSVNDLYDFLNDEPIREETKERCREMIRKLLSSE